MRPLKKTVSQELEETATSPVITEQY